MAPQQPVYHSRVYRDFFSIAPDDYHRLIRFFEAKEADIGRLDGAEYFDLLVVYVNALFAVGAYRKHLMLVDLVIEAVIRENIYVHRGHDLLYQMLFRKAASCFRVYQLDQARHILCELLRIYPRDEDGRRFLRRVLRSQQTPAQRWSRAVAILCFGLAALVIILEVLAIKPFYSQYSPLAERVRNLIFVGGIFSLLLGEVWQYLRAYLEVRRILGTAFR